MVFEFLKQTFLLDGLGSAELSVARDVLRPTLSEFEKGERVFGIDTGISEIGFVLEGKCEVRRVCPGGDYLPLNSIEKFGSFGVLSLFSTAEYPTEIYAKRSCTVVFLSKENVVELLRLCPSVSMNVISFLSERIAFLNDKIASFSGGSVSEKLAAYLLSAMKRHGATEFKFNKKLASEALNCGRASVYRSLDNLVGEGIIQLDDKKIIIKDPKGLERMSK